MREEEENVIPGIYKKGDHKNLRSTGSKTATNSTKTSTTTSQSTRFRIFIKKDPTKDGTNDTPVYVELEVKSSTKNPNTITNIQKVEEKRENVHK